MLGNMGNLKSSSKMWMEVSVGNHQGVINDTHLYEESGESICAALPAFHAFTGCDYNAAFFRKGKKRPYKLLKSSADFQEAFKGLSRINEDNCKDIFDKIEEFLCHLYGLKKIKSVDEARFVLFNKAYTFKDTHDISQISTTNVDGSNLRPCKAELQKQLQRAAYISNIWSNAHEKQPTEMCPEDNG